MGRFSQLKGALRRRLAPAPVPAPHDARRWTPRSPDAPGPGGRAFECEVDNRVFLLGLDALYRRAMKEHERGELLACARRVSAALKVPPADVPLEGYYSEHADLTAYFRLMRALQHVPLGRAAEVASLPEFRRLFAVTSSPIFGSPTREFLLPVGSDPLSKALKEARSLDAWTVPRLTAAASAIAREDSDCSIVGLAARTEDPVLMAAVRESVVLYAEMRTLGLMPASRTFVWRVDADLSASAQRFVDTFNALFGEELPPVSAEYAHVFGEAADVLQIIGRCVRIGQTDGAQQGQYHWAVARTSEGHLAVDEFWAMEIWTTDQYRNSGRLRKFADEGAPSSDAGRSES
jgi:hypothetical protein